nr:Chain B, MDS1 and EVI1 complex locus protein MDS1 [Homo sapiens]6BW3_D Chain D, MDS1 and EVI1 complex locus protein MDS1 [Homo sapiens]
MRSKGRARKLAT